MFLLKTAGGRGTAARTALCVALALGSASALFADADGGGLGGASGIIRIGIVEAQKGAVLEAASGASAVDLASGARKPLPAGAKLSVSPDENGIRLGDYVFGPVVRISAQDGAAGFTRVNDRSYRGSIIFKKKSDKAITAIEELGLEEYLYGVLPAEMGEDWPEDALKAQAVVARTYALYSLNRFADFDLTADVRSQAYSGADRDHPRIMEAVRATSGQVLMWKGGLVHSFFHSNCGGRTTPSVWGGDEIRPLKGVYCPYCKYSRDYSWTVFVPEEKLLDYLRAASIPVKKLKSIRMLKRNGGGRTITLRFKTDIGGVNVDMHDLRACMSAEFRSTYIVHIQPERGGFRFSGRGYGHGVGMCQDGARKMAWTGKSYKQILKFYYPGAKLDNWHNEP